MHHSFGCEAQMRPDGRVACRGEVQIAGVLLDQKLAQAVGVIAHPAQHSVGVEWPCGRLTHGVNATRLAAVSRAHPRATG